MEKLPEEQKVKNYDLIAVQLDRFVRDYTPAGWEVPIRNVMSPPFILAQDIKEMEVDYKNGVLKDKLDKKYKNPNISEAFLAFFERN